MPDLLLDGLPVIDLLEITASTSAVAALTQRDQSSVSRIYRQASSRLGLAFGKDRNGCYRASANQELLHDLRRSSQKLRLRDPSHLRWIVSPWHQGVGPLPGQPAEELAPALHLPWSGAARSCALLRQHVLDLAVVPGLELLEGGAIHADAVPPIELACGQLLALPLLRQPLTIAAPAGHPLHGRGDLRPADLAGWPLRQAWPAAAPQLKHRLQQLGLTLSPETETEAPATPTTTPSTPPTAPLTLLPALALGQDSALQPLPVEGLTGLEELDLIVLHRALLQEAPLQRLIEAVKAASQLCHGHRQDLVWPGTPSPPLVHA